METRGRDGGGVRDHAAGAHDLGQVSASAKATDNLGRFRV